MIHIYTWKYITSYMYMYTSNHTSVHIYTYIGIHSHTYIYVWWRPLYKAVVQSNFDINVRFLHGKGRFMIPFQTFSHIEFFPIQNILQQSAFSYSYMYTGIYAHKNICICINRHNPKYIYVYTMPLWKDSLTSTGEFFPVKTVLFCSFQIVWHLEYFPD